MANCGCGNSGLCLCEGIGGKGVKVTIGGAVGLDYLVSLDLTSGSVEANAGCEEVMGCVNSHVSDGLAVGVIPPTPNQDISIKVDPAPGNAFQSSRFGVYAPLCPGVGGCGRNRTIRDLPATGVLCGDEGTGTATNPTWTREMMSLGHAHADTPLIFTVTPVELADGTLWWHHPTGSNAFNRNDWNSTTNLTKFYSQQVSTVHYNLDTGGANNNYYCGTLVPGEEGISVNELLARLGGVTILRFRLGDQNTAITTKGRTRLENMVLRMGLQKSVMFLGSATTDRTYLKNWATAGGVSAGYIRFQSTATAQLPGAPALLADGITWLYLHYDINDLTMAAYKSLGFKVVMYGDAAHDMLWLNGNRIRSLQITGGCSDDPFYTLQPARNYDFRSTVSPWRGGKTSQGMYTGFGTSYSHLSTCLWRGTYRPELAGQFDPPTDIWYEMNRSLGVSNQAYFTHQAWAAQMPNPNATLTGIMRMTATPTGATAASYMAVAMSMVNDRGVNIGGTPVSGQSGFILFVTGNSQAYLAYLNQDGSLTQLGVTVSIPLTGEIFFQITTTATSVSAYVTPFGGSRITIANGVPSTAARGWHLYTLYRLPSTQTPNWDARFRHFTIVSP